MPFLVPSLDSLHREGDTQTLLIRLKDGPVRGTAGERCSVASAFFRLIPSRRGPDDWEYRSLTAGGWARESSDVYEDWKVFLQKLASSQYSGCFSADEDVFSIQRRLAAVTPLPATEVDAFLYSNDKDGYVDLAPGMEILIRDKPSSETAHEHSSELRLRIEARRSGGVRMKRVSGSPAHGSYPDMVSNYASVRFLRLFLQGISDYDSRHNPLLLGASDVQSLDAATRAVQSSGRTLVRALATRSSVRLLRTERPPVSSFRCGSTGIAPSIRWARNWGSFWRGCPRSNGRHWNPCASRERLRTADSHRSLFPEPMKA